MGLCYKNAEPFYYQALSLIELGNYSAAQLKLEDVMERFPKTKFNPLAKRKLISLKLFKSQAASKNMKRAKNNSTSNAEILSPNF